MDKLEGMPVDQRQDAMLESWASGEGIDFVSPEAKAAYQYRAGLMKDAVQLKKTPDRVPIVPLVTFAPTSLEGISGKEAMNNPEALGKAFLTFMEKYGPDAGGLPPMVMYAPGLEVLDYKLYKWPGHGVKDDLYYQFNEKEYMKADEYDHFITDLSDYWYRIWLPRICGALEGLANIPPVYYTMELPMSAPWLISFGDPAVQKALNALMEAGNIYTKWIQTLGPAMGEQIAKGYPNYAGGFCKAPFDVLSDSFRGTTGLMMDLYRQPDKVVKAQEKLIPLMIDMGAGGAIANGNPFVFIPLHKGADGFMSNDQFEKFYWPGLKTVMLGLIERGCVPVPFVEGGYNQRLEYLAQMPEGKTMFIFDRTDMVQARKVLGGKSCIGGGFPISLILAGTPEEVETETKKLLDAVKGDGGYVLSIGCALDDAKADTVEAFVKAGKKYGKY
ncbi:MAG: uroporphyrinogen decarboxylase family protein [Desulfobacteraceae bacterium]